MVSTTLIRRYCSVANANPLIHLPWFGPKPSLTLQLEGGKTYYLQGDEKLALWPPRSILALTEVVPNAVKLQEINNSREEAPMGSASN